MRPFDELRELAVRIPIGEKRLEGDLALSPDSTGLVIFAHGSGSSRHSVREIETSPRAVAIRLGERIQETVAAVQRVPLHLDAIGRKMRDGRFEVQFVHRNLDHFVREMDRSSNRLSFAIVIGSLVVGSAVVVQAGVGGTVAGYPVLGFAGFIGAGVLGIGLAIGIVRSGRL